MAAAPALIAGFVNGAAIAAAGQPVSHLTGTIARLSQDLAFQRPFDVRLVLLVVAAFFAGAVATRRVGPVALLAPAVACVAGGALYIAVVARQRVRRLERRTGRVRPAAR